MTSAQSSAAARQARSQHIEELLGFPAAGGNISPETTIGNIADMQESGQEAAEAMQALIESRIDYIYKRFVENKDVRNRHDLNAGEILQIGCLAILEAAERVNLDGRDPDNEFSLRIPSEMGRLLIQSKLAPGRNKRGQLPAMRSASDTAMLREAVKFVPDDQLAAYAERYGDAEVESVENEIFGSREQVHHTVVSGLQTLDRDEKATVEVLYLYRGIDEMGLRNAAYWLGRSHTWTNYTRRRALNKIEAWDSESNLDALRSLMDDDQTNYGLDK